jgi:DNA-binding IclR family transcriptional regulator
VQLLQMMTGYWVSQGVYVAAKLGIADHLATGPVHYEDLARKTNTHALSLYRTLRALASVGVFAEINTGRFALTPLAGLLQSNLPNSMRALAIMYCEEQYRAWGTCYRASGQESPPLTASSAWVCSSTSARTRRQARFSTRR